MHTSQSLILGTYLLLLASPMWSTFVAEAPNRREAVEITSCVQKSEVAVGETVRLQELIPQAMKVEIRSISHRVLRIGGYSQARGKLVNFPESAFSIAMADDEFVDLPGSLGMSHGLDFEVKDPRYKGVEFEFHAKRAGIYLITSRWRISGSEEWITSAPLVLVVKPPRPRK
jgi:hypothetical protein